MVDDTWRRGAVPADWSGATVEFAKVTGRPDAVERAVPDPVVVVPTQAEPADGRQPGTAANGRMNGARTNGARTNGARVTGAHRIEMEPAATGPVGVVPIRALPTHVVPLQAMPIGERVGPGRVGPGRVGTADRLVRLLLVIAVILVLLSLGLPNIAPDVDYFSAPGSPIRLFFGVSEEANLPTFFSVLVMVGAAGAHALAGTLARRRSKRIGLAFFVTATILFAMAFDDFVSLHERLYSLGALIAPSGLGASAGATTLWVVPGLGLAILVVAAFSILLLRLRGRARRDLILALAIMFGAALGIETINGELDHPGTNGAPLQIGTHIEELLEDVAAILFLRGALRVVTMSRGPSGLSIELAGESLEAPAAHQRGASTTPAR